MSFQLGSDDNVGMSEMNLVPLIDIMLVLMIIFLVTATVLNPTIPLTLPKTEASAPITLESKVIQVSIDKNNDIFLDKKPLELTALAEELTKAIAANKADNQANDKNKAISLNIRADKDSNYDAIAKVLATASKAGLTDIAFVSDSMD